MRLLLLVSLVTAASIAQLTRQDVYATYPNKSAAKEPLLIFIYYERSGFSCHLCDTFKAELGTLGVPVRSLNFAEDVELGSRFLQHTFPAFVVREAGRSYVLEPQTVDELREMMKTGKWRENKPVRKALDVDSAFAVVFSKINRVVFFGVHMFYYLMDYVPDYMVTVFILGVISFLAYSIVDVLRTKGPIKQKLE